MSKKKILMTGANGIIGNYMCQYLKESADLLPTYFNSGSPPHPQAVYLDISQKETVLNLFVHFQPEVIIHLAGKNLKFCESNQEIAYQINVEATKIVADAAGEMGAKFIFVSSDYVFDGIRGNYKESDKPNPCTVYGKTKMLAEQYLEKKLSKYAIIRTSGLYGKGTTFYDMVINALTSGKMIEPFMDTYFSPTHISDLAWAINCLSNEQYEANGLFHVCGETVATRFEMAFKMVVYLHANLCQIKPISSRNNVAHIAQNTSLNCESTVKRLNKRFLTLTDGLANLLEHNNYEIN